MANQANFNVHVGYTVDQSGLDELHRSLQQVVKEASEAKIGGTLTSELEEAGAAAQQLESILNQSWNSKLNQLDLSTLNQSINTAYGSLGNLKNIMESSGSTGAAAYNKFASSIMNSNLELKESNKLLDSMATTMGNTVKWTVASSAMNALTGAVESAWSFTQKLDTSLNDIRIVTEKSAEDMAQFAEYANSAAKSLGASTTDYTNASLIYYQQGLSDEEVQARTDVTLKAANVTGQTAREVSEELTAVWNGYQVTSEEAEESIDILAAVAANTATDLEELSTGMSKVASAANTMGVSEEQLAAQLSTITAVTRQAPETTGQALRTIYARMSTINAGGTDEDDGATLTSYSAKMDKFGISVLDANGKLRDMGEVIEEIGEKWDDFTREQQISLAQAMAGTRQYNNLLALFENWDEYTRALGIAEDATGTLQQQQDIYMESVAAHLQQLNTTAEETYNILFDTDTINQFVDVLTSVLGVFNNFLTSLGGGTSTLAMLGVMGVNVFSNQIGGAIEKQIENQERLTANQKALETVMQETEAGISNKENSENTIKAYEQQEKNVEALQSKIKNLSSSQYNQFIDLNKEITDTSLKIAELEDQQRKGTDTAILTAELKAQQDRLTGIEQSYVSINDKATIIGNTTKSNTTKLEAQEEIYDQIGFLLNEDQTLREGSAEGEEQSIFTLDQRIQLQNILNNAKNNEVLTTDQIKNIVDLVNAAYKQQSSIVEETNKDLKNQTDLESGLLEILKRLNENRQNSFDQGLKQVDRQKLLSDTTKLLSGTVMGINSVSNAVKTLQNSDLSAWEKFSQIVPNLAITVPQLVKSFQTVPSVLSNVATLLGATATQTATFGSTLKFLAPEITAVIAAIAGIVQVVRLFNQEEEESIKSAKNAAIAAENLATANSEVASAISEVENQLSAYEDAQQELADCTKGTDEWKEALDNANTSASTLLQSLEKIAEQSGSISLSDLYTYDNGQITINEDALSDVMYEIQTAGQISAAGESAAEWYNASVKNQNQFLTQLGEFLNTSENTENSIMNTMNRLPITESSAPDIITDMESLFDNENKELLTELYELALDYNNHSETAIDEFRNLLNTNFPDISDYLTEIRDNDYLYSDTELFSDSDIESLMKIIIDNVNAEQASQDNLNLLFDDLISQLVVENEYNNATAARTRNQLTNDYQNFLDAWQIIFDDNSDNIDKIAEDIKKAIGYNDEDITDYGTLVELLKSNNLFVEAVEEGTQQITDDGYQFIDSLTGEIITYDKGSLAQLLAISAIVSLIPELLETNNIDIESINSTMAENGANQDLIDLINNFIANPSGSISESTPYEAVEALNSDNNADLETYLQDLLGEDVDLINLLGSDYLDQINTAIEDYITAILDVPTHYLNAVQEALNDFNIDDFSVKTEKQIADILQDTLIHAGDSAMQAMSMVFQQIAIEGNLEGFFDVINSIDFTSEDATVTLEDFKDALEGAKVQTDLTDNQLSYLVAILNDLGNSGEEAAATLTESFKTVNDVIKGLEQYDTISSDQYQTLLTELGSGISSFFSMTLEGEYKLIGSAEELKKVTESIFYDRIDQANQQSQQRISEAKTLSNSTSDNGVINRTATNAQQTLNPTEETQSGIDIDLYTLMQTIDTYQQLIGVQDEERAKLLELQDIELGTFTEDQVEWIQNYCQEIQNTGEATENFNAIIEQEESNQRAWNLAIAESCTSVDELHQKLNDGIITQESFNKAYDEMYEASRLEGLDSNEVSDYAKHLQTVCKDSETLSKSLEKDDKAANDLATQIMRMNNGVDDLAKNFDDWSDVLKNSSKSSQEYSEALSGLQDDMSDLLDIDTDFLSEGFLVDHLDDIALAARGDADAIDRLRAASYEDILIQIGIDDSQLYGEAQLSLADIQSFLNDNLLQVGASISDIEGSDAYIESLNALIDATAMTSDQVQAMLGAMGYNVTFEEGEDTVTSQIPTTYTTHTVEITGWKTVDNPDPEGEPYNIPEWTTTEQAFTTYEPANEEIQSIAAQIETEGGTVGGGGMGSTSAHVANITKKATGSANNGSSRNAGGNSSSGGSGGGGGGGGSGSSSEPKVEEHLESSADRYHDINLRLQQISTSLSRLQGQEQKLFGQNLINNLNEQLAVLNDQIDATNIKLQIAQQEAAEYRDKLTGQGVEFDSNGYISNYSEVMQSQLDYVNSIIDKYNGMTAEQQEAYQDTLDAAKDAYNDFVQDISDYDTLISETIEGLIDDIQDSVDQKVQIEIQKFTMEVEIRLNMEEAEKDWNEFYRRIILGINNDDIVGGAVQDLADLLSYVNTTASDITDLTSDSLDKWLAQISEAAASGTGIGSIQSLTDQVNNTIEQLQQIEKTGTSSVYGNNESQALEDLQNYYTELMNELEDVQDLVESIEDSYLDMIDEAIDAFDKQVDQYEYINDLLNHDINLVSLIYGDDAYETMARYYEQIETNNNNELDFLRRRVQYAEEMMNAETDDEAREKWQEEWEDALSTLNSKVEDSVQNIIDKYTNVINQIISELNDSITDGLGLDYVGEEWDLMNQEADIYLDTINSLYAIQDLRNKYTDAINSTDDIAAQQRLNELMEEQVAYLEEKGQLTQYDVDRAELEYEIALKQIALEEAQRNKSSMRLRRDAQGNYTYQYVSDQDAVADAQAELLDLQNQLYNMDKDAYKDNLDQLYSVYQEFQEKILELYEDQTLSAEEREEKIALYVEYYGDIINSLVRENSYIRTNLEDSAMTELAALYETDVENFKNMSDAEVDELMTSLVPQWDSGVQHMADTFAGNGGFTETCKDALADLDQATQDYSDDLKEMADAAGIDLEQLSEGYDKAAESAEKLLSNNEDLINEYADQIDIIKSVIDVVDELTSAYQKAFDAAEKAATAGYETYQNINEAAATAASEDQKGTNTETTDTKKTSSSGSGSSKSGSTSNSKSTQGDGQIQVGDKVKFDSGWYYYDSYGTSPSGHQHQGEYVYITKLVSNPASGQTKPIHISSGSSLGNGDLGWLTQTQISGYDTGGYTGDWDGSNGALALLHQKELVLNSQDTENILNAVGIVRDMASMLNALDASVFNRVGSLINGLSQKKFHDKEDQVLEQEVHIEANFPNVNSTQEIEDAFNELVNVASQYAYHTQR